MNPRILATFGPLKGSAVPVTPQLCTLGRDASNEYCLEDALVSRRHCSIQLQDGAPIVHDLESKNGTFVNDVAVSRKVLQHGDRLKIGSSTFIYLEREGPESTERIFTDSEHDRRRTVKTVAVDRSEPFYPNTDHLQARILEMVFLSIPADRAAILLLGRDGEGVVSGMGLDRDHSTPLPFVGRTITQQVVDDNFPALSNDGDSVLCVPLTVSGTRLGVIYANSADETALNHDHLGLLAKIADVAVAALGHTRYVEWLEGENRRLKEEINPDHNMIGDSPGMRAIREFISRASPVNSTVLILGESGTGKELVAHAIHRNSIRSKGPFVAVNCGAIVETLLESELFGSEKGAFTGAVSQQKGKIEVANGGTLFLDEVGELSYSMQTALLRVLQEREFHRVGGTRIIKVDARIVAATNRDLEGDVKEGRFRRDLFYRLQVLSVTMPPLSARREDIPALAAHFIRKYRSIRNVAGITPEAEGLMRSYDWPGNIRELENAIERACTLGISDHIRPEDLFEGVTERKSDEPGKGTSYYALVSAAKKAIVEKALDATGGNYVEAAKLLGIHLTHLYRLVRNLAEENPMKAD